MRILLLCTSFTKGHGVAVVVRQQAIQLVGQGHEVHVLCEEKDEFYCADEFQTHVVVAKEKVLLPLVESFGANVIVVHTDPFFTMLPKWKENHYTIAWEHGQPPPELFPAEAKAWRTEFIRVKKESVYPRVHLNVGISKSIVQELGLPNAKVVYNGLDHLEFKVQSLSIEPQKELRLLKVSRLDEHVAEYKGLADYAKLVQSLRDKGLEVRGQLAGKGSLGDQHRWEAMGLEVLRNLSDQGLKEAYLDSHVVVSLSKWEGFNLPLAEAQYYDRPAFALDHGPHREVTEHVFASIQSMGLVF